MGALNLNHRQKIYIVTASFLAGIVLLLSLVALPIFYNIKSGGDELAQKRQTLESFLEEGRTLENAKKDYQKIQQELNALPALLPVKETIKFIMFVEQAARATNNQEEISVAAPAPTSQKKTEAPKKSLIFQINLKGNFPNLMKFLAYLENAPYYNDINSVQIQRVNAQSTEQVGLKEGDINTLLKVTIYQ